MIHADLWLTAAVFIFYLWECIRFLKQDEIAFTGVFTDRVRKWEYHQQGYTLLGRHLCIVNPFRVGVGMATFSKGDSRSSLPTRGLKAALKLSKPARLALGFLCSALGLLLFVELPIIVYRQLLALLWRPLLAEILLVHITISILFATELRRWQSDRSARTARSVAILLNPVAAIRCIDILSQAIFDELRERSHRTRQRA